MKKEGEGMSGMPWNLKGYAGDRLGKLDVQQLQAMCAARGLECESQEDAPSCIEKLLEWKKAPKMPPPASINSSSGRTHRSVNINVIALDRSRRLAQILQPALADSLINERRLNGDFRNFDDVQQRVRGVGKVLVASLKSSGFVVKARAAGDDDTDGEESLGGVRMNVSGMAEQVWRHRHQIDLYTQLSPPLVLAAPGGAEVDHVWECQLINDANKEVSGNGGPASRTRAVQGVARHLFNGAENLNVTTHAVNQNKKGPFTRWRNQRAKDGRATMDELVRETAGGKGLVDEGHWARITRSVVAVWDELDQRKEHIRAARAREHADAVLRSMHFMMEKMEFV